MSLENNSNTRGVEELLQNVFSMGDYSFAQIEFGPWIKEEDGWDSWVVWLHLKSCDIKIPMGTCWMQDKEVSFYPDMDDLMGIVIKEVSNKTRDLLFKEFGATINPQLNVQIYGVDYT